MVHINEKYDSLDEALKRDDGLAVIGILLDDEAKSDTDWFKTVSDAARSKLPMKKKLPASFNLKELIDEITIVHHNEQSLKNYFTYEGSLTTPPCNEVVTWIVSKTIVQISPNEVSSLRELKFPDGSTMEDNWRPVQPLNGRHVTKVCH